MVAVSWRGSKAFTARSRDGIHVEELANLKGKTVMDDTPYQPHIYRTQAEADAYLPQARAILDEVIRRLPTDEFITGLETLFIGRELEPIVACAAARLRDFTESMTVLEFELEGIPFEDNVDELVSSLKRYRRRYIAGEI
jgi:hypothetical protein